MGHQNLPDQPEWLKNHNPPPGHGRGNPKWHKGMKSPNPHGRKAVLGMARTEMAKLLQDNVGGVMEKQIEKALEGDSAAAQLVLSRVVAPLKASGERVRFSFDPTLPLSEQLAQVAVAVASGDVPPDVGQQISAMLSNLANVRTTEELEQRLTLLEAKAVNP
ncbi:hypothetical protein [Pararhodobacter sp.]|uniref:hypothetical protein n=1 Tax=Pararhodobacter sp. TaxID=2127056 RepID=UPI002FDECEC1